MTKTVAIGSILTKEEVLQAAQLYEQVARSEFAERCAAEIIRPAIERINKVTGQENDAKYLAYCVEYALMKSKGRLDA